MITLHRINGEAFTINADLIETVESTPDTVIRLVNGHRYVVAEPMEEIVDLVVKYRQKVLFSFLGGKTAFSEEEEQD
ncbi:MAG: flagellar FlbD family protein [Aminivibrio sp.]|jgi:flagellar protein FlbD|nr:flagellar FlbD family protein [Aminivibrio sp.]